MASRFRMCVNNWFSPNRPRHFFPHLQIKNRSTHRYLHWTECTKVCLSKIEYFNWEKWNELGQWDKGEPMQYVINYAGMHAQQSNKWSNLRRNRTCFLNVTIEVVALHFVNRRNRDIEVQWLRVFDWELRRMKILLISTFTMATRPNYSNTTHSLATKLWRISK